MLRTELGVEPAAETIALFEQIKAGKVRSVAAEESLKPPTKAQHNLPAATIPLIGRELELAQLKKLLTQGGERLVTIVGAGGMGKTRLALAVGKALLAQFKDVFTLSIWLRSPSQTRCHWQWPPR